MRVIALSLAIMALVPLSALAARNDQWILGIDHIDNEGAFTVYPGTGYSGPQSSGYPQFVGNAYYFNGFDGVARVHWQLSGNAIVNGQATGNAVPTTTELYKIEFYGTSAPGRNDWQQIEGDFDGSGPTTGEALHDSSIPWVGEGGVNSGPCCNNHQWIAADQKTVGQFSPSGPGPHSPHDSSYNAASNGIYMWLTANSELYAKWSLFPLGKSWSAIRLTQATPLPGPPVTGDYNGNGVVDAADYVVWRKNFPNDTGTATASMGDGNHDGYVDEYDYDEWRLRFGRTSGSGSGAELSSSDAVPEPATLTFVSLVIFAYFGGARNCRGRAIGQ